eukprot:scaffold99903_cov26-Tisochrysis_lutea.AAC.1
MAAALQHPFCRLPIGHSTFRTTSADSATCLDLEIEPATPRRFGGAACPVIAVCVRFAGSRVKPKWTRLFLASDAKSISCKNR